MRLENKKNILIVDDDANVRRPLSEILENAGYDVEQAASGKEAIKKAAAKDFDIVLLDLIMPNMSGMSVLSHLREVTPKTKVIMLTAFPTIENVVDAMKNGASDYISKPYRPGDLLTAIRRALEETKFEENIGKLSFDSALASLSNPTRRNVVRLLSSGADMHFMEIARELGIEDHTKIAFHLRSLKESGIIKQGEKKTYSLTKEGEKILHSLKILDDYFTK